MNHRVRSVLAAVLIMVVSILLPSDFQFENTDRFVTKLKYTDDGTVYRWHRKESSS